MKKRQQYIIFQSLVLLIGIVAIPLLYLKGDFKLAISESLICGWVFGDIINVIANYSKNRKIEKDLEEALISCEESKEIMIRKTEELNNANQSVSAYLIGQNMKNSKLDSN